MRLKLIDEFTIAGDPDRAFALLLDLTRIAPCVPGGEIGEPDADGTYPGRVSVKLGPMKFVYDGKVRIVERDPEARTAVIEGEGRASGGADTAKVSTLMQVLADGDRTQVRMTTELDIKGKAARWARASSWTSRGGSSRTRRGASRRGSRTRTPRCPPPRPRSRSAASASWRR